MQLLHSTKPLTRKFRLKPELPFEKSFLVVERYSIVGGGGLNSWSTSALERERHKQNQVTSIADFFIINLLSYSPELFLHQVMFILHWLHRLFNDLLACYYMSLQCPNYLFPHSLEIKTQCSRDISFWFPVRCNVIEKLLA